jgi:hypothetical protein
MTTFRPHPNNVSTTLAGAYTAGGTTLTLASGAGPLFGNTFPMLATVAQAGSYGSPGEVDTIYSVTARTGDVLTIAAGGVEGTTDRNYAIGDRVEVRWTDGLAKSIEGAVNTLETTTTNIQAGLLISQPNNTTGAVGLQITSTWNNSAVGFNALYMSITDTGSTPTSNLMAGLVGGVVKWRVDKTGTILAGAADGALITTGTIAPARLATAGTPGANSFLRGDQAWVGVWNQTVLKSGPYTMAVNDRVVLVDPSSGSWILTLPSAAAAIGNEYLITNNIAHASNTVTIQRQGSDGIDAVISVVLSCTTQFKYYRLVCVSTGLFVVAGSG